MPEPIEPDGMKKKHSPDYHLADSDDEEDDTVETRKSVKTIEKRDRHRFFINAKERKEYEKNVDDGKIEAKQMNFEEDSDDEVGPRPAGQAEKRAAKKVAVIKKAAEKEEEAKKPSKQKKKEEKEKEIEEKIAKSKEPTPIEEAPAKVDTKEEDAKVEDDSDKNKGEPLAPSLPPELAGALMGPPKPPARPSKKKGGHGHGKHGKKSFAQVHNNVDSDSDSDSGSDSDSD